MIRRLSLRSQARTQITTAFNDAWGRNPRRAELLLAEVDEVFRRLLENPFLYAVRDERTRRVNLRRFPYAIRYQVKESVDPATGQPVEQIIVFGFFHQRQDPARMRDEP